MKVRTRRALRVRATHRLLRAACAVDVELGSRNAYALRAQLDDQDVLRDLNLLCRRAWRARMSVQRYVELAARSAQRSGPTLRQLLQPHVECGVTLHREALRGCERSMYAYGTAPSIALSISTLYSASNRSVVRERALLVALCVALRTLIDPGVLWSLPELRERWGAQDMPVGRVEARKLHMRYERYLERHAACASSQGRLARWWKEVSNDGECEGGRS